MLWQELYIACVLETNPEKLKALIHETENAIISRLHTLETLNDEHQEIARYLGCSTGSSKSQLHKARKRLRRLLQGEECAPRGAGAAAT